MYKVDEVGKVDGVGELGEVDNDGYETRLVNSILLVQFDRINKTIEINEIDEIDKRYLN